jgi:hypothetical protein
MNIFRVLCALPILPTATGGAGWLRNRRRNSLPLCAPLDVAENATDWWHSFTRRLPPDTVVLRDRNGRIGGYGTRR